jgi:hypothetical protein
MAYFNGRAFAQTNRIRQVRMCPALLCIDLDHAQIIPHTIDQVIQAAQAKEIRKINGFEKNLTSGPFHS